LFALQLAFGVKEVGRLFSILLDDRLVVLSFLFPLDDLTAFGLFLRRLLDYGGNL